MKKNNVKKSKVASKSGRGIFIVGPAHEGDPNLFRICRKRGLGLRGSAMDAYMADWFDEIATEISARDAKEFCAKLGCKRVRIY